MVYKNIHQEKEVMKKQFFLRLAPVTVTGNGRKNTINTVSAIVKDKQTNISHGLYP